MQAPIGMTHNFTLVYIDNNSGIVIHGAQVILYDAAHDIYNYYYVTKNLLNKILVTVKVHTMEPFVMQSANLLYS